jgi:hypothetical protein
MFNQAGPTQHAPVYERFGLDPQRVLDGMIEMRNNRDPNRKMKGETNAFRVTVKTLLQGHIITDRTRGFYATYVDMEELAAEGGAMPGEAIAEDGIRYLQAINFKDKVERGAAALIAAE